MLAGGQFSKSRKHAIWLPSFLERFDPDTLRYYLSINMPESHDTDFTWNEFVDRINNELIATYGNFANRVLSLSARLPNTLVERIAHLIQLKRMEGCVQRSKHYMQYDRVLGKTPLQKPYEPQ